jgi:hypothetical protein
VKPLSLLMSFWLSLIWMASLTRRSMYTDALSNTETLKSISCPALMLCSATADFSDRLIEKSISTMSQC